MQIYTTVVRPKDTLQSIAYRFTKDQNKSRDILAVNPRLSRLYTGQKINLPSYWFARRSGDILPVKSCLGYNARGCDKNSDCCSDNCQNGTCVCRQGFVHTPLGCVVDMSNTQQSQTSGTIGCGGKGCGYSGNGCGYPFNAGPGPVGNGCSTKGYHNLCDYPFGNDYGNGPNLCPMPYGAFGGGPGGTLNGYIKPFSIKTDSNDGMEFEQSNDGMEFEQSDELIPDVDRTRNFSSRHKRGIGQIGCGECGRWREELYLSGTVGDAITPLTPDQQKDELLAYLKENDIDLTKVVSVVSDYINNYNKSPADCEKESATATDEVVKILKADNRFKPIYDALIKRYGSEEELRARILIIQQAGCNEPIKNINVQAPYKTNTGLLWLGGALLGGIIGGVVVGKIL